MRSKAQRKCEGFASELIPVVKSGLVALRSILELLIEQVERLEKSRESDFRKETFQSIIEALKTEVKNTRKKDSGAPGAETKIDVLESIISVLAREIKESTPQKKKGKRAQKVKIR